MNKTYYKNKQLNIPLTIICAILLLVIIVFNSFLVGLFILISSVYKSKEILVMLLFPVVFLLISIPGFLGSISGLLAAKRTIDMDYKKIKISNPYIYYRELPNNYGVGVASLLMDSKLENEKDIVAVILDLCAKGYLKLNKIGDKYVISIIRNKGYSNLLSNERYIINHLISGDIANLNYEEWFNCCMNDGIYLHLFDRIKDNNSGKKTIRVLDERITKRIIFVIALILDVLYFLIFNYPKDFESLINSILMAIFLFFVFCFLTIIVIDIMSLLLFAVIGFVKNRKISYNTRMSSYLKPTELGIEELHKLYSFASFINDFGEFASKNPEEIVLWDYYLSYAQVFGLADKILETGYYKLIKNSSFDIDNIDSIKLSNIDVIDK